VVVLPGTPAAFKLLLKLRDHAINTGFHIQAPCPHTRTCPMANQTDQWCHVRKRLDRNRVHRETKKGIIGYEDEPYCYLVVSPVIVDVKAYNRIINAPRQRPGHVYVDMCTPASVIETSCITKKDKELFKRAKNIKWGDRA
jgi:ribosomal protein RSM22 (predicted rRNA methylase)